MRFSSKNIQNGQNVGKKDLNENVRMYVYYMWACSDFC